MTETMTAETMTAADPAPELVAAVDRARAAVAEETGDELVGAHVGVHAEDAASATHLFEANQPGYHGWRWAVTVANAGPGTPVTISEVVLLPGPEALIAPEWVPWQERVKAGDLGIGDLMPPTPGDPRLVPAYLESDDEAVEQVATEVGLGRVRVMSRQGRLDVAHRWRDSDFGPRSDMARSAPEHCGTCGFYLPVAGALRAAFGVCGNEISPADGHVVHVEFGCGAHSQLELESSSPVPVADLVYDDSELDVSVAPEAEPGQATDEPKPAELQAAAADSVLSESVAAEQTPADAVGSGPADSAGVDSAGADSAERQ